MSPEQQKIIDATLKEWADRGLFIEGGWQVFADLSNLKEVNESSRRAMRTAFFVGAHHLFASVLQNSRESSTAKRLDLIEAELQKFVDEEAKRAKGPG